MEKAKNIKIPDSLENNNEENTEEDQKELVAYSKPFLNLNTISGLTDLTSSCENYQKIVLSNNKLTNITEFFIFKNLQYLDLSNNLFQKLAPLTSLKELQYLDLSFNQIRSINMCLARLKKLKHLDLSNNKIDVEDGVTIKVLKNNTELSSLLLRQNINYNFDQVKFICLEHLKNLIFLDEQKIIGNKDIKKRCSSCSKTFINVRGIKGNSKKISGLKEYIKFKLDDINNNKEDYEEDWYKKQKIIQDGKMNGKITENIGSTYYMEFLASQ